MFKHIRYFFNRLNYVRKWLPVLWEDRHWDEVYLYKILHKKLELKEEFFRSNKTYTACALDTADEIKEVKDLFWRLVNHDYLDEALEEFHNKYGKDVELFDIDENGKMIDLLDDEAMRIFSKAGADSDIARDNDKKKAFKLMDDNISGWWD